MEMDFKQLAQAIKVIAEERICQRIRYRMLFSKRWPLPGGAITVIASRKSA